MTNVAAPKWLVQRHGLAALVARAGAASYREELVRATVEWARIEADLPPVVKALRDAGVRAAPIKGVAYAKHLYASPAERPMADIDLLVPPDAIERAAGVLARLGFMRAHAPVMHHAHAWVRGELVIDLHRSIIAPGRSKLDLARVWSRMLPGWPAGAEQLEASDALVFHLVNLARNSLQVPLVHVIDTARLRERGDERIALDRARTWNLGRAVAIASQFCSALLEEGAGRPAGWLGPSREEVALLRERGAAQRILFDIAIAGSPAQLAARAVHFSTNRVRELMRARH